MQEASDCLRGRRRPGVADIVESDCFVLTVCVGVQSYELPELLLLESHRLITGATTGPFPDLSFKFEYTFPP